MSLTLPYPDMVFVPLDILTAQELNEIVSNVEYISDQFPIAAANLASNAVTTAKISDEAVTADKIDFGTFTILSGTNSSVVLPTGNWIVIAIANLITEVEGSFSTNVSWLGITKAFQGYRPSGQNKSQSCLTFVNSLEVSQSTTYSCSTTGSTATILQAQWLAFKMGA